MEREQASAPRARQQAGELSALAAARALGQRPAARCTAANVAASTCGAPDETTLHPRAPSPHWIVMSIVSDNDAEPKHGPAWKLKPCVEKVSPTRLTSSGIGSTSG